MGEWIKSLRLSVCIFAGILSVVSFKICNIDTGKFWLCGVAVVVIACATMVHNDWRDRFHDVKKGKCLAVKNPKKYLAFDVAMWIIAVGLSIVVTTQNFRLSLLLWLATLSGLLYSETRRIPMVPIFLVSVTSASATLFPVSVFGSSLKPWLFFFAILMTIFGREIIKDLQDVNVDSGYKWTLPLKLGVGYSKILASVSIVAGLLIMATLSLKVILALPFTLFATYLLISKSRYQGSKRLADAGMVTALLMISL